MIQESHNAIKIRKLLGLAKSTAKEIKQKLHLSTLGQIVDRYEDDLLLTEKRQEMIQKFIPLFYSKESKACQFIETLARIS